jgi:DNA polymerase III epsilon subunit-like protein
MTSTRTRTIIFDTETTGLPRDRKKAPHLARNNWPDLVSICWKVYENTTCVRTENHIIRPEGWVIPDDVIRIHGISNEEAHRNGQRLQDVLLLFRSDLKGCSHLIAHNIEFDRNVLYHAYLWRLQMNPESFWPTDAEFCSAQESVDELKLPMMFPSNDPSKRYKIPTLDELYTYTFNRPPPSNAHNALRDVEVLSAIIWARWILVGENNQPLNPTPILPSFQS